MIDRRNFYLCLECYAELKKRGMPLLSLLQDIFESYAILKEPVAIINDNYAYPVIEYLERNKFIITTEFPDLSEGRVDIVLVQPLGRLTIKEDLCFFCFDEENHE